MIVNSFKHMSCDGCVFDYGCAGICKSKCVRYSFSRSRCEWEDCYYPLNNKDDEIEEGIE